MNSPYVCSDICILTKQHFFRPNENMHIQMSNEFPDYIGILHKHEYIEVVYIVSGFATHEIAGKTYEAKRGDLFIINKGAPHVFYENKKCSEPFVAYDLMFTPEFFDTSITGNHSLESLNKSFMFYSMFTGRDDFTPFFSVSGSVYTMFGDLFNKIYLEHRNREKGYMEIIRAYLLQLIITIFRVEDKLSNVTRNLRNTQIVNYITDYISENYNNHISVKDLAQMVCLNPDYLGRIFRKETGTTISKMIQRVRIENVCSLLSATNLSISDIATSCGFADMKFFYNVFKKHTGALPSQYRNQKQNQEVDL